LDKETTKGFKILKFKDDFIGCGKSTGREIKNFLPKERRIKN
jgi:NOL1/NOP2/fmu family ribosome biogenesis protein